MPNIVKGYSDKDIVVISIMPCVAKKYESSRPELGIDPDISDVDYVMTTRELASMIKDFSIDFENLEDSDFDDPMGESTGAAVIFGASGGVSTAALRTAYKMLTGEDLGEVEFKNLLGLQGVKEAEVEIGGDTVRIAVASGLGNARKILQDVRSGAKTYHIIEIMACPGGCIDGGGQPYIHGDTGILEKRMEAIQKIDRGKKIRLAHENESLGKIYREFLGRPGGERAHKLLHTHLIYRDKL